MVFPAPAIPIVIIVTGFLFFSIVEDPATSMVSQKKLVSCAKVKMTQLALWQCMSILINVSLSRQCVDPSFLSYHPPWALKICEWLNTFNGFIPYLALCASRRQLMSDPKLYNLSEGDPKFGPIPRCPVGSTFKTR